MKIDKLKFDENGNLLPYYGNTIISFVNDENTDIFKCVLNIQKEFLNSSFANCLAPLPPLSFHMTNIPLCRDRDRGTDEWPPYIDKTAKFKEIDCQIKDRVDLVETPKSYLMEVDHVSITTITLKSYNKDTEIAIRKYRDDISKAVGIKHKNHNEYQFHISMNYLCQELNKEQEEEAKVLCEKLTREIKGALVFFEVSSPNFVIFNDMFSYHLDLNKRGDLF